jgi:hypothetical protein
MPQQPQNVLMIPDTMQERIRIGQVIDPEIRHLEMVSVLGRDAENTLTELSYDEAIDFAILKSLHDSEIINLQAVIDFIQFLKVNRVALDRKGIDEYLKGIIGQPIKEYAPYGMPGTVNPEDKPGVLSKLAFWRKEK